MSVHIAFNINTHSTGAFIQNGKLRFVVEKACHLFKNMKYSTSIQILLSHNFQEHLKTLTYISPIFHFYIPDVSGGIEMEHWTKMG